MRTTEIEIKTRQEKWTHTRACSCDICGAEIKPPIIDIDNHSHGTNWANDDFNQDVVGIYHETGYSSRDGGELEITSYDVCPECFKDVITPLMKNPPTIKNVDF